MISIYKQTCQQIPESSSSKDSSRPTSQTSSIPIAGRKSLRLSSGKEDGATMGEHRLRPGSVTQPMKINPTGAGSSLVSSANSLISSSSTSLTAAPVASTNTTGTTTDGKMSKIFSSRQGLPSLPASSVNDGLFQSVNTNLVVNYKNPSDIPRYGVDVPDSRDLDEVSYLFLLTNDPITMKYKRIWFLKAYGKHRRMGHKRISHYWSYE